jgi:hypothetical protein
MRYDKLPLKGAFCEPDVSAISGLPENIDEFNQ